MNTNPNCLDFFLGVNSPVGFASYFNEISDYKPNWKNYIIKGGPGTGKSSLIKSVANTLYKEKSNVELIHCSSDPSSLDAIISHQDNFAMCDGTPPHAVEPTYPGLFETVINFCEFWDEKKLAENKDVLINLFKKNKECHERCLRFLTAASSLINDNFYITLKNTNTQKIAKLTKRLVLKEFSKKKTKKPIERKRFLSAITPEGIITYTDTATKLAEKIYIIKDELGVSSSLILSLLRQYALEYGYEIYSCYCPMNPYKKLDHLFIPELNLGFMTENKFNKSDIESFRIINFSRFLDIEELKLKKQKINMNRKIVSELMNEAILSLKTAKSIHDDMESFYINAVDFNMVNNKSSSIINLIKSGI